MFIGDVDYMLKIVVLDFKVFSWIINDDFLFQEVVYYVCLFIVMDMLKDDNFLLLFQS